MLYPLSYGNLRYRQESNLRLLGLDVTHAFTTPQIFENSYAPPRTAPQIQMKPGGKNASSRFGLRGVRLHRLVRRIRELHHPGKALPVTEILASK
jgi:hypothetical protein